MIRIALQHKNRNIHHISSKTAIHVVNHIVWKYNYCDMHQDRKNGNAQPEWLYETLDI
jgi:hypothetical protein